MLDSEKPRHVRPDLNNQAERELWNAVCHAMNGSSHILSNACLINWVIQKLSDETWREKMREVFRQNIRDVAVPDLERVTFCETGAVTVATSFDPPDRDVFEENLELDREKAQVARKLATALKQHM